MPAERTVRRLRLRAADASQARRAELLLLDALRTASLPGDGAAVVLVRRLALPPFRAGASAQTLALALEARCRALDLLTVTRATTEDELAAASAVRFHDPLHARRELGVRLLRRQQPYAWCWPLAVPGYRGAMGAAEALRAVALSLAGLPEAGRALPSWMEGIVAGGGAVRLVAALGADDAASLLALLPPAARRRAANDGLRRASVLDGAGRAGGDEPAGTAAAHAPPWRDALRWAAGSLEPADPRRQLLEACARACAGTAAADPARPPAAAGERAERGVRAGFAGARPADPPHRPPRVGDGWRGRSGEPVPSATKPGGDADAAADGGRHGVDGPRREALPAAAASPPQAPAQGLPADAALEAPTCAAGLLFLLRVLDGLGLPRWLEEDAGWRGAGVPERIFALALWRLRVPADDPAWLLAAFDAGRAPAGPLPWRRLAGFGVAATAAGSIEAAWLAACRRWLRTRAHIGLADLVRRPGLLALTATHADVRMPLAQADIRVRRAGLDIDPGWVAWLGRVVHFHYGDTER